MSSFLSPQCSRADRAAVDHQGGAVEAAHRHDAAGHVLVAAGQGDVASYHWPPITVSMESAMKSRDCSEYACRRSPSKCRRSRRWC